MNDSAPPAFPSQRHWLARLDRLRIKLFAAIAGANVALALISYAVFTWSFDQGFVEYLNENCRPFKMKPLEQKEQTVLLQWEGDCRITGEQFEYRRVQVAADGVHFLAYATKMNRLSAAKREAWLNIVGGAKLK